MALKKEILYSTAKLENGNLVTAKLADKGDKFYCYECNGDMILRKSGKTGKGSKRPHFAHKNLSPNCSAESVLHKSFKELTFKKIKENIQNNIPLEMKWNCDYCGGSHNGNLLKKVTEVKLEYNLGVCQPDIALLNDKGEVHAVIEVVVTHKPEDQVLQYYRNNNIILIQIDLKSDNDIYEVNNKLSVPNIVDICFNPKCQRCGEHLGKMDLLVVKGTCWKCDAPMNVAVGVEQNMRIVKTPKSFTLSELSFARSKGVIISNAYSGYNANRCPKCNMFVGEHFLFTSYVAPAGHGDLEYDLYEMGYYCDSCDSR